MDSPLQILDRGVCFQSIRNNDVKISFYEHCYQILKTINTIMLHIHNKCNKVVLLTV